MPTVECAYLNTGTPWDPQPIMAFGRVLHRFPLQRRRYWEVVLMAFNTRPHPEQCNLRRSESPKLSNEIFGTRDLHEGTWRPLRSTGRNPGVELPEQE